jgi:hypothetical protein
MLRTPVNPTNQILESPCILSAQSLHVAGQVTDSGNSTFSTRNKSVFCYDNQERANPLNSPDYGQITLWKFEKTTHGRSSMVAVQASRRALRLLLIAELEVW